jgi:hypothetical protein
MSNIAVTPHVINTSNITGAPAAINTSNITVLPNFDSIAVHRLLFKTSYSSAVEGINIVFGACKSYKWCASEARDWCPDAINSTLTSIADRVIAASPDIDYDNMKNITLLSTISSLSAKSERLAISWAQSLVNDSPVACGADHLEDLRKYQWYISEQEGRIEYDADTFDKQIAEQDPGTTHESVFNESDQSVQEDNNNDDDDDDDDDDDWQIALPFLAAPSLLLGPLVRSS